METGTDSVHNDRNPRICGSLETFHPACSGFQTKKHRDFNVLLLSLSSSLGNGSNASSFEPALEDEDEHLRKGQLQAGFAFRRIV